MENGDRERKSQTKVLKAFYLTLIIISLIVGINSYSKYRNMMKINEDIISRCSEILGIYEEIGQNLRDYLHEIQGFQEK